MNFRMPFAILLSFLLLGFAGQTKADTKYGKRPTDSVYDPSGVLSSQQQREISEPLLQIFENEGIDIIVVILPKIGEAPADHIARAFAKEWIESKMNAVVLHVPSNPDSPWIVPGTIGDSVVEREKLARHIFEAEQRAAAEPDDFGKIRAASIEAADAIRYMVGKTVIRSEHVISQRQERRLEFGARARMMKLSAALAVGAMIMVAGFVFLYLLSRKKRPKFFPAIRKTARFGAPYAGGNHAVSKSHQNSTSL